MLKYGIFTFGVKGLAPSIDELFKVMKAFDVSVSQLYNALIEVSIDVENKIKTNDFEVPQLFNFLIDKFENITTNSTDNIDPDETLEEKK